MDIAIDHYAILGLEYGATREEIKKAHRKLVLRCLPLPRLPAGQTGRGWTAGWWSRDAEGGMWC